VTRVTIFGGGRVGSLIARDLSSDDDLEVRVLDRDEAAVRRFRSAGIQAEVADLGSGDDLARACDASDLVVGAVPGFLGRSVLEVAIETGTPVADISFSPDDPLDLGERAREKGVPILVDFGVAPGLSNLLAGRAAAELDPAESIDILVGGLPFRRVWPYEYVSVFSPTDVIEEYTRPSRVRIAGIERVRPALSGVEFVDFPIIGTLEAFETDGLRTLLRTLDVPTLREKTLRYPGHAERMRMLRETGFFSTEAMEIGGVRIRPRDLTERLLFQRWEPAADEEEFTVLRVVADGVRDGRHVRVAWDLFDRTDFGTGTTSMARTTGFPCAIAARMLASRRWTEPGVHPPEVLGRSEEHTRYVLDELARRGVEVSRTEEMLE
jgi:saccharopine dehydrogenase-like NADP-dependent oxidoreductase